MAHETEGIPEWQTGKVKEELRKQKALASHNQDTENRRSNPDKIRTDIEKYRWLGYRLRLISTNPTS